MLSESIRIYQNLQDFGSSQKLKKEKKQTGALWYHFPSNIVGPSPCSMTFWQWTPWPAGGQMAASGSPNNPDFNGDFMVISWDLTGFHGDFSCDSSCGYLNRV